MTTIEFSSVLPEAFRGDVESLLFFNPLQSRARSAICESIDRYGEPRLAVSDGLVTVSIADVPGVQTLYAVADYDDGCALAGVAVYTRERDRLIILHLAVAEEFAARPGCAAGSLAVRLTLAVRRIASSLTGIRALVLPYGRRTIRAFRRPLTREAAPHAAAVLASTQRFAPAV
jgi:hypothetical protein